MNTNKPAHFAGLPNWAKITIVFASLLLGALSIGFAWKDATDANKTLTFGQKDVEAIKTIVRLGHTETGNDQALLVHTLNAIIHLKAITNHQSLAGLAIGASSAFLAIGFALFLLGADGAFRIQFAGNGDSKLTFYATAPGLLCFLLGTILIIAGTTRKHEIRLGDFKSTDGNAIQSGLYQDETKLNLHSKLAKKRGRSIASTTASSAFKPLIKKKFCIERLLIRDIPRLKKVSSINIGGGRSGAIISFDKLWNNGSKLRVKFLDGDLVLQAKIIKYAEQWAQYANIQFEFGAFSDAEIRVSFNEPGLWSYIGTDAIDVPKHSPTMNLGGITSKTDDTEIRSIVLHEFGHALGLQHEFEPPKSKFQWNHQFIQQYFALAPNHWSLENTNRFFIEKYTNAHFRGPSYDSKSIMVMVLPKEFILGMHDAKWNLDFSDDDKKFIASNQGYPK